nr:odorant binding protein 19 [Pagiophloeus tsushimanus]
MKKFAVLTFLVVLVTVKTELTVEQREKLTNMANRCTKETGATEEMVQKSMNGEFSEDPRFKEFLFCVDKQAGFVDESGKRNRDALKMQLVETFGHEDKIDNILDTCLAIEKPTPQETAFELAKCFYKELEMA